MAGKSATDEAFYGCGGRGALYFYVGHDFRPAFRRIISLVRLLPKDLPVLATTATATGRVQNDIVEQMGAGLRVIRGNLVRDNFNLYVVKVNSQDEKMAWLAQHYDELEGTGILYTGTRREARRRPIRDGLNMPASAASTTMRGSSPLPGSRWKKD